MGLHWRRAFRQPVQPRYLAALHCDPSLGMRIPTRSPDRLPCEAADLIRVRGSSFLQPFNQASPCPNHALSRPRPMVTAGSQFQVQHRRWLAWRSNSRRSSERRCRTTMRSGSRPWTGWTRPRRQTW